MKKSIIAITALVFLLSACGNLTESDSAKREREAVESLNATTPEQIAKLAMQDSITNNTNKDSWSGTYIDADGRELTLSKQPAKGEIKFSLNMANENCQEVFEGSAFLYDPSGANYTNTNTSSKCTLTIVLDGDGVTIKESSDFGFHGGRCGTSDGHYKRK